MSFAAILNTSILGTERSALPESLIREMVNSGAPQDAGPEDRLLDAIILSGYRQKFAGKFPKWEKDMPEAFPRPFDFSLQEFSLLQNLSRKDYFVLLLRWLKEGFPFPDALFSEISSWYMEPNRYDNLHDLLPYLPENILWVIDTIPMPGMERYQTRAPTVVPDPIPLQAIAKKYLCIDDRGFIDVRLPEFEAEEKKILQSFSRKGYFDMRNLGFKSAENLYKFGANLPLQWWVQAFGQAPHALLEKNRLLNEEFRLRETVRSKDTVEITLQNKRNALVFGWIDATLRQADRPWATALCRFLETQTIFEIWKESKTLQELAALVPPKERAKMLEEWLPEWRQKLNGRSMLHYLLTTGPETWNEKISRQVIHLIQSLISESRPHQWLEELIRKAGLYLHLSLYSDLKYEWETFNIYNWYRWEQHIAYLMKTMWYRKQLTELSRKIMTQDE